MDDAPQDQGFLAQLVGRPVLAFVLNALIVLAGCAALFAIEVRELPRVDNPVITVTTTYDGATPETIDREITDRVEGAVSRVSGVRTISSSSSFGTSRVTVELRYEIEGMLAQFNRPELVTGFVDYILGQFAANCDAVLSGREAGPARRLSVLAMLWAVLKARFGRK